MSVAPVDILAVLKKLRKDLNAAQAALTSLETYVGALNLDSLPKRTGPNANSRRAYTTAELERLIDNGVITDLVELDAEIESAGVTVDQASELRKRLAQ